jgi:hypothetical protein
MRQLLSRIGGGSQVHGAAPPTAEFLPDSRLEQIWERLYRELTLPDETRFSDTVEPDRWADQGGIAVKVPERVYFWVVCPNPQPRWKDKVLKEYAFMDLTDWRLMEATKWRFAGVPDPAYTIFKKLCERLIVQHKSWREMN